MVLIKMVFKSGAETVINVHGDIEAIMKGFETSFNNVAGNEKGYSRIRDDQNKVIALIEPKDLSLVQVIDNCSNAIKDE